MINQDVRCTLIKGITGSVILNDQVEKDLQVWKKSYAFTKETFKK